MTALHDLTLYLVRHGECRHNVEARVAGQSDSPLTARGIEHARANGRALKQIEPDLANFQFISSPTHRTAATMELAREAAGLTRDDYIADRRLMELDTGDNTFRVWAEVEAEMKADPAYIDRWRYAHPGGESLADLHGRIGKFLPALTGNSVIVTHSGPMRMIRAHYLGLAPQAVLDYKPLHAGILRLSAGVETYFGE
ncbi:MAG TPA: histidine phosphatase family protein [Rhizomicrobium sp.]|jgi:probable phosphoglycerate mutase|nr:histidine phosphatase family protein [Rhizomicrobium sp.]